MHCALQRHRRNNTRKVLDAVKGSRLRKPSKLNHFRTSLEDCEEVSLILRNFDERFPFLPFFVLLADGQWKMIAFPLQRCDHANHLEPAEHVKMNGLHFISAPSMSFFDYGAKTNISSSEFSHNFFRGTDSLDLKHSSADGTNSSDLSIDSSKANKAAKKSAKKKTKKKGKQKKKVSCDSDSQAHGSSYIVHGDELNTCTATPSASITECRANESNSDGDGFNVVDEVDALSSVFPDNGLQQNNLTLTTFSEAEDICERQTSCYDDSCFNILDEMTDPSVIDSVSVDKTRDRGKATMISSEPPSCIAARTESLSHLHESNDDADFYNDAVGTSSNSNGTQLVPSSKRGKQGRRSHSNSSIGEVGGSKNSRNRNSVWQKVQKNDDTGCDPKMKKSNGFCMELDVALNGSSAVESSVLSSTDDKSTVRGKSTRKLKRKSCPGSKHDCKCHLRKGSHAVEASSNLSTSNLQLDEQNHIKSPQIGEPKVDLRTEIAASNDICISSDGLDPVGNAYDTASATIDRTMEAQNTLPFELHDPFNQSNMVEASEVEEVRSTAGYRRQDHGSGSGSVVQKWIPVGLKGPESTRLGKHDPLPLSHLEEPVAGQEVVSDAQSEASSMDARLDLRSGDLNSSSVDNTHVSANFDMSMVENDAERILQAVDDSCKVRVASEAVLETAGIPIAEFEIFLHSASPVICRSRHGRCPDQAMGASLCRHEMPAVSLGSLWAWYEKHGNYGLEVRGEDCENLKRLGADCFAFRAYFVPFLSAVQLFGTCQSKSCAVDDGKGNPHGTEFPESFETVGMLEASLNADQLSIFSLPMPKTCTQPTNAPVGVDRMPLQSDDGTFSDDSELLFEYFEHEPPQQRRPLFEKIKGLVKGDGQCQAYGDPTKLDSLDLRDLHPRSWYSVAWYPIYKIPDGKFRTAFLTYHSLGHLAGRSDTTAAFESGCKDVCIVSPVVGLQSYNTQGESWFQLKHGAAGGASILKERLRSLERAASAMARGAVMKGDGACVNRHPDYEFFLSRLR